VLQSDPSMADEAEKVAEDLLSRVNQRKADAGGELHGNMLITWKDLKHTLGEFRYDKKDYFRAIDYFEGFLKFEITDQRDALALEKLVECYTFVGRDADAKKVRQLRIVTSERLLRRTNTGSAENEKAVNHDKERNDDDDDDGDRVNMREKGASNEGTAGDQMEAGNDEDSEEEEADEFDDTDVEIQLMEEQMAELKQRLSALKQAKSRGKGL
jgi:hypothetical protein